MNEAYVMSKFLYLMKVADLGCLLGSKELYVELILAHLEERKPQLYFGDWAWRPKVGEDGKPSSAPFHASSKALELLKYGAEEGITATPLGILTEYQGGVRAGRFITAVSAWQQEADKLFASVLMYGMTSHITLESVIRTHVESTALWMEVGSDRFRLRRQPVVNEKGAKFPGFGDSDCALWHMYGEQPGLTFELACAKPMRMMQYIGEIVGQTPITSNTSPFGQIEVPNRDEIFAIQAVEG